MSINLSVDFQTDLRLLLDVPEHRKTTDDFPSIHHTSTKSLCIAI